MAIYHGSAVLRNDGTDSITNKKDLNAGVSIPVKVEKYSDDTDATLYDINDNPIANPVTTDSKGNFVFKAADDEYNIYFNKGTADEVKQERVQVYSLDSVALLTVNETATLTDGQTVVTFSTENTTGASFHINGVGVDSRLLTSEDIDQVETTLTSITLFESYPAGTVITLSKNSGTGATVDATIRREFVHNFATLADAVSSTKILAGDSVNLKERTTGNGGGAMWDVVLASSVTANTYNIVACTGVASLALVLRVGTEANVKQFGAKGDNIQDTKEIHELASTRSKVVRFPTGGGEIYKYTAAPVLDADVVSYINNGSKVKGINAINNGFTIEPLPLINSTVGSDSIDIKWHYDGEPVGISLTGNSIREHCIIWHPLQRTYYMIGDVLSNTSPHHPNTYDSEIGLWKCNDPATLQSWNYLGICIEKGTGTGQGQYGVASATGASVMDDGTILVPFSSRDSSDFVTRSIGMASSSLNPDTLPWTKRSGYISKVSVSDDDPAIVRDLQTDVYHLFHRSTDFNAAGYRISHLYTTDPLSGVWLQTDDANNILPFTSVTAQEVTAAFVIGGVCNLWTMEQGTTQPATAWWVSKSNMQEFKPKDSLNRHLPTQAFGKGTLDPVNGHATPIIKEGEYIGTSFTVSQGAGQYGVNINLIDTDKETKRCRVRLTGDQTGIVSGAVTTLEFNNIVHDTTGWFDAGTYRFTPQIEGYYRFNCQALIVSMTTARAILQLEKNGTRVVGLDMKNSGATQDSLVQGDSGLIYANGTTDYFDVAILQESGSNKTVRDDSTWTFLDITLEERKYNP